MRPRIARKPCLLLLDLIVGWGTKPKGDTESWIAVIPEPSTGWLVTAGLAGLVCLQRARRG